MAAAASGGMMLGLRLRHITQATRSLSLVGHGHKSILAVYLDWWKYFVMVPLGFHFMHACQAYETDREREDERERDEYSLTLAHIRMWMQNLVPLLHQSPFCLSIIATVIVIIMIVYCIAFLYFYCRVHRVRSNITPAPFVRVICEHFTSTNSTQ